MNKRSASIKRETTETSIKVEITLDGSGDYEIMTGVRMFDHLLSQLARHGMFDIKITGNSSDQHHLVEDVGICLGKAFAQALGEKKGIVRMAHAVVPMDEALAMVAVDIGGRGYCHVETKFAGEAIAELSTDLVRHFLESFAIEAKLNLHARVLSGVNDHHKAEALFKAMARALDSATRIDDRLGGDVPSTKGIIER
ncbi:MAG: imidazoleglycerol-phosphate dehydratase HisB [Dehalococcoidia bacterium]|nr:imidazoleglycerol-phosphate dehydratase HisB [Dehalococcoidia bacterium]MDZ4245681.1 imidazoleglycerol-phosphate dehydratase HisB [Dehalococcoidia bacterium]